VHIRKKRKYGNQFIAVQFVFEPNVFSKNNVEVDKTTIYDTNKDFEEALLEATAIWL
jgi:hypothetical protein